MKKVVHRFTRRHKHLYQHRRRIIFQMQLHSKHRLSIDQTAAAVTLEEQEELYKNSTF